MPSLAALPGRSEPPIICILADSEMVATSSVLWMLLQFRRVASAARIPLHVFSAMSAATVVATDWDCTGAVEAPF